MAQTEFGAATSPRFHNFDLLRLVAATSVVFSHAFGITDGNENAEPFVRLLGRGNIVGIYGVYIFFIISGFLITASFHKSALPDYVLKRVLRIVPGLAACVVVTTAVALLVAWRGLPPLQVLEAGARYIAKTVLFFDTSSTALPGVVFSGNDFGRIFNGSLWSLGPEMFCYVAVAVLGVAGVLGPRSALAALALGCVLHATYTLGNIGFTMPFFAAGALLYHWPARPRLSWPTAATAAAGLVAGAALGVPSLAFAVFGAWLVIALATAPLQIPGATRFGDLSYGVYLYGWPIEQTVRHVLGTQATWWLVFLIAMPLTLVAALVSWRLVEKPALRFAGSRRFHRFRRA